MHLKLTQSSNMKVHLLPIPKIKETGTFSMSQPLCFENIERVPASPISPIAKLLTTLRGSLHMAPEGGVLTLGLAAPHLVSAAAGHGQAPPSQSATAAPAQQEEQELHRLTLGNLS